MGKARPQGVGLSRRFGAERRRPLLAGIGFDWEWLCRRWSRRAVTRRLSHNFLDLFESLVGHQHDFAPPVSFTVGTFSKTRKGSFCPCFSRPLLLQSK